MKPVLIDTDIISYFLKGNEKVFLRFQEYLKDFDRINISIITYYEVVSGLTFKNAEKQLQIFEEFCSTATIINLSKDSIKVAAKIFANQRKKGKSVDDIDILIAGIAISNDLVLVTNNTKHFGKIDGLEIDNWI